MIGREEARKSSDQSVTYATRPGGRRKSRQSSGPKPVDRVDLALRSVSREHERTLLVLVLPALLLCGS